MQKALAQLRASLDGELLTDALHRTLYSTDASVYKETPLAVAYPRSVADVKKLIRFATDNRTSLIPRTAGTSLGGQCVGTGIVVDVSKHWNKILEINVAERWVRVQPGVIRDELNVFLAKHGLFFGPVTATSNRAMIGGMVGNNSCGATSIVHGTTRDHVLEIGAILSDGSEVVFGSMDEAGFLKKTKEETLEGTVYRQLHEVLQNTDNQLNIRREYPKDTIHRRNTGYAVDVLLDHRPFSPDGPDFNLCKLLTGSEGTLAFTTSVKLNVVPLPPPVPAVLCAHFASLNECMEATLLAMQHRPDQCELVDKITLDCTRDNIEQAKNRFFVQGDPAAVLMVEFRRGTQNEANAAAQNLIESLQAAGMGYAFPIVRANRAGQVWALRNAGLGVMSNVPGDAKPYSFVEDTAVALEDLPAYIREFDALMRGFGQNAVYYAHAGAGELHVKPVLNLKNADDVRQFRQIAEASARLVKKYNGSLSGEHGDGRVRGEFIPMMLGEANYQLLRSIKKTWDPHGIFNPGKITDAPPMDANLRYEIGAKPIEKQTVMDFSDAGGFRHMAEKCNGSGDCRRLDFAGGTMCPSYRATRDEKDTTRARANALREFFTVDGGRWTVDGGRIGGIAKPDSDEMENHEQTGLTNPFRKSATGEEGLLSPTIGGIAKPDSDEMENHEQTGLTNPFRKSATGEEGLLSPTIGGIAKPDSDEMENHEQTGLTNPFRKSATGEEGLVSPTIGGIAKPDSGEMENHEQTGLTDPFRKSATGEKGLVSPTIGGIAKPDSDEMENHEQTGLTNPFRKSATGEKGLVSPTIGGIAKPDSDEMENHEQTGLTNPFRKSAITEADVKAALDLCLSCKGCTSECPSNVDMTTMKAEFTHQYYQKHGVPARAKFFGHIGRMNAVLSKAPRLANFFITNSFTSNLAKRVVGVAPQRSLPPLATTTLRSWYDKHRADLKITGPTKGKVFFFCDEFTDFYDAEIGVKALKLLARLGYEVEMPLHPQSGRAQLSKGLLPEAQALAKENVRLFVKLATQETPLVGLEPSAILGFRDEYPRLVDKADVAQAKALGTNALLIDEFLSREIQAGQIDPDLFTKQPRKVLLHGHCHQKALSSVEHSVWVCALPDNYDVEVIPSGCCGMAGSFGYEAEHYEVSMKVGELVLFPAIRNTDGRTVVVAAPGTSCRHQILDGTGRKALHPVEVLFEALKPQ